MRCINIICCCCRDGYLHTIWEYTQREGTLNLVPFISGFVNDDENYIFDDSINDYYNDSNNDELWIIAPMYSWI